MWALSPLRTTAALPLGELGVRGVRELDEDVDEDGRGTTGLEDTAVLTVLVGRAGEGFDLLVDEGAALVLAGITGGLAGMSSLKAAR